jgi:hypothetical protein
MVGGFSSLVASCIGVGSAVASRATNASRTSREVIESSFIVVEWAG